MRWMQDLENLAIELEISVLRSRQIDQADQPDLSPITFVRLDQHEAFVTNIQQPGLVSLRFKPFLPMQQEGKGWYFAFFSLKFWRQLELACIITSPPPSSYLNWLPESRRSLTASCWPPVARHHWLGVISILNVQILLSPFSWRYKSTENWDYSYSSSSNWSTKHWTELYNLNS